MLQPLYYKRIWFALGILLLLGIVIGSLIPVSRIEIHTSDKIIHVLMYLLLMAWFAQIMEARLHLRIAIFFVSLGLFLEYAQHATGYRSFEWGDVLANFAGVAVGWVLGHTILSRALSLLDERLAHFAHRDS